MIKGAAATTRRLECIQAAMERWIVYGDTVGGRLVRIRAAEDLVRQAILDRRPIQAQIELDMGWSVYRHHRALSALQAGRVDDGVHELISVVWSEYLKGLWRHNGFHTGAFEDYSDCLGIGYFLTAYLLNQQPIVEGAAKIYLSCEDGDELDSFLSGHLDNRDELVGSKWDLLCFLKAFGHDVAHLIHDEGDMVEAMGDYAAFLDPDKDMIGGVLYGLCEAHVYACSTKNRENTQWGLFPVRILAYMKLSGLRMADYADVHPLLSMPTCQMDFSRQLELDNPLVRELRSLVEEIYDNGLMPMDV